MSPFTTEESEGKAVLAFYIVTKGVTYKRCTLLIRWSDALSVDIMHGHDPSSKMHPQLQLKKTKVSCLYSSKGIISAVHF